MRKLVLIAIATLGVMMMSCSDKDGDVTPQTPSCKYMYQSWTRADDGSWKVWIQNTEDYSRFIIYQDETPTQGQCYR